MTEVVVTDLLHLLHQISNDDYGKQSNALGGATIGQHIRHSIEMYQCVIEGYNSSLIDYGKRKRNLVLETSAAYAIECINAFLQQVKREDKTIALIHEGELVDSSFKRELLYCNEHLIHHMALIKVVLQELNCYKISENFGIAPSTIKNRQQCVQ